MSDVWVRPGGSNENAGAAKKNAINQRKAIPLPSPLICLFRLSFVAGLLQTPTAIHCGRAARRTHLHSVPSTSSVVVAVDQFCCINAALATLLLL